MTAGYLKERNGAVFWIQRKKERNHESKCTVDNDETIQETIKEKKNR